MAKHHADVSRQGNLALVRETPIARHYCGSEPKYVSLSRLTQWQAGAMSGALGSMRRRMLQVPREADLRSCQAGKPDVLVCEICLAMEAYPTDERTGGDQSSSDRCPPRRSPNVIPKSEI